MRLLRVAPRSYGHFEDQELDLSGSGLQVLYGPNEAGKSTLLNFVRELLFGFADRTPYAFRGTKVRGSARVELADRREFDFDREKGRPDKLTLHQQGQPRALSREEWERMLGGANRELFERIFAFDLRELAAGEEALKEQGVEAALFGVAVEGRASPVKLLEELSTSAAKLFMPNARTKEINTPLNQLAELKKQLKKTTLKSDHWLAQRRDLEQATQRSKHLQDQLRQVQAELTRNRRLLEAIPVWHELTRLERELSAAGPGSPITSALVERYKEQSNRRTLLAEQLPQLQLKLTNLQTALAATPDQSAWLQHQSEIEHLRGQIQSVAEARRDLPNVERDVEQIRQRQQTVIRELVPEWEQTQWQQAKLTAEQKHAGERLRERARVLAEQQRQQQDRLVELQAQAGDFQAELQSTTLLPDLLQRQQALAQQIPATTRAQRLQELARQLESKAQKLKKLRKKLAPCWPVERELTGPVAGLPRESEIAEFESRWLARQAALDEAERALTAAQQRVQQLQHELEALLQSDAPLPNESDLQAARQQRDELWERLRRLLAGDSFDIVGSADSPENLAELYHRSVQQVDLLADTLLANHSAVEKQRQLAHEAKLLTQFESAVAQEQTALQELEQVWKDLWAKIEVQPKSPAVMQTWLTDWELWQTEWEQQQALLAEQTQLQQAQQACQALLRRLFPELPLDLADDFVGHFGVLQSQVQSHQQAAAQHASAEQRLSRVREKISQTESELTQLATQQREWLTQWAAWLQQMSFPAQWEPELAERVLSQVQELRLEAERLPELEHRVGLMQARIAEFDPHVRSLCNQLAPEWGSLPAENAAQKLADLLQKALSADQQRLHDLKQLDTLQNQVQSLQGQLTTCEQELDQLQAQVGVADEAGFLQAAERAQIMEQFQNQLHSREQEFSRLHGAIPREEFQQQLLAVDDITLQGTVTSQQQQLEALQADLQQANQDIGARQRDFETHDGSGDGAKLQAQIAEERAKLAQLVEQYIPLCLAQELLQQAVRRFEEQSQPELLRETSRIFEELTDGRYIRVERPTQDNRTLLVHPRGKSHLTPGQLSTGTREQLYLALRLAYMRQYCQRAEPLPMVLDDVCANFDPERTRRTFRVLQDLAAQSQVLFFTCHPTVVELAREVSPAGWKPISLPEAAAT